MMYFAVKSKELVCDCRISSLTVHLICCVFLVLPSHLLFLLALHCPEQRRVAHRLHTAVPLEVVWDRQDYALLCVVCCGSAAVQRRWVDVHSTQSVVAFIKGWQCHTGLGLVSSLDWGFMLLLWCCVLRLSDWEQSLLQTDIFSVCQCF